MQAVAAEEVEVAAAAVVADKPDRRHRIDPAAFRCWMLIA